MEQIYAHHIGEYKLYQDLYEKSKNGHSFKHLWNLIIHKNNFKVSYKNIGSNSGKNTPGPNGLVFSDLKKDDLNTVYTNIVNSMNNFEEHNSRLTYIPKANGKMRPLGIGNIDDRIKQDMVKNIIEPILEGKFKDNSYGFRPHRSAKHAIGRLAINCSTAKYIFVNEFDFSNCFNEIPHRLIIKNLYKLGIRDKKVLSYIKTILKSPIDGVRMDKGVPQGGILSPVLANVALHSLDTFVNRQWSEFNSKGQWKFPCTRYREYRKRNLRRNIHVPFKRGYLIRYADDFVICCPTKAEADRWFHAVVNYVEHYLKIPLNLEKSGQVNVTKQNLTFLGFKFNCKGGHVVNGTSGSYKYRLTMSDKLRDNTISKIKKLKWQVTKHETYDTDSLIRKYNSMILGVNRYINISTNKREMERVNRVAYRSFFMRLRKARGCKLVRVQNLGVPEYLGIKIKDISRLMPKGSQHICLPLGCVPRENVISVFKSKKLHPYPELKQYKDIKSILKTAWYTRVCSQQRVTIGCEVNISTLLTMQKFKDPISKESLVYKTVDVHHKVPYRISNDDSFANMVCLERRTHVLLHHGILQSEKVFYRNFPNGNYKNYVKYYNLIHNTN